MDELLIVFESRACYCEFSGITLQTTGCAAARDNSHMNLRTHSHDTIDLGLTWRNTFAGLGEDFYSCVSPQPLPDPYWVAQNPSLARELGLPPSWCESGDHLQALSGNRAVAGAEPLASVYSGHQFGVWAGQLGDGRAILLGQTTGGLEVQLRVPA